jgi:hypothetical protein
MGAWGHGTFEDDTACDWLGEFQDKPSLKRVESALNAALKADDIDDLIGPNALAAAEVVAALNGKPVAGLKEEVLKWAASQPRANAKLLAKAKEAVTRVFQESELREIWDDAGSLDEWEAAINELQARLVVTDARLL